MLSELLLLMPMNDSHAPYCTGWKITTTSPQCSITVQESLISNMVKHTVAIMMVMVILLGDYFIAELIEAQDESHRTIVADVSITV